MSQRTKWIIGVSSTISILAIVTPILFYVGDFHALNRSSNPADWGTFGDFFGGILNPVISLLTLVVTIIIAVELKRIEDRNRKKEIDSTYKPQLVIEQGSFYLYSMNIAGNMIPSEFTYEIKDFNYVAREDKYSAPFAVNLYNIGLGATKKIRVSFDFAIEDAIKVIRALETKVPDSSKVTLQYSSKAGHESLEIKAQIDFHTFQLFNRHHQTEISHLLSVSVSPNPFRLIIPTTILDLYRIFMFY